MRAGAAPEPGEVGGAAVAAHHHHRARRSPAAATPSLDELGGAQRDRQDRRVERGGDGAQLEAVEPGQLGRRARPAGRRSARQRRRRRVSLRVVVGRERLGDADRADAGVAKRSTARAGVAAVEAVGDVEELGTVAQRACPARARRAAARCACAALRRSGRRPMPMHARPCRRRPRAARSPPASWSG